MTLKIVRNDIAKVKADAIVNSANKNPVCGGGAEFHIYEAAGRDALLAAREKIGVLNVAEVAVTPAFALNAKYIIHVVGPKWNEGDSGEIVALENCYRGALEKALELGCESIAFPLIASGVYHFPKGFALRLAMHAIGDFLQAHEMDVQLVVYDRKSFEVSERLCDDVLAYIDDNYVQDKFDGGTRKFAARRWNLNSQEDAGFENADFDVLCVSEAESVSEGEDESESLNYSRIAEKTKRPQKLFACACARRKSEDEIEKEKVLEKILATVGATFCDTLFSIIREKNLDDVDVYKKANLDRKHFSKIRSNVNYRPTKKTALALAIALQLNLDQTKDLLARAEIALSPSNKGDLIVSYFISHHKFDIWEINSMLFKFGQPTLGA